MAGPISIAASLTPNEAQETLVYALEQGEGL
jgi:hypothetical protein